MTAKLHVWGYHLGCPACTKLKALFDNLGVDYVFHGITKGSPERAALKDAGFDTVPQVFTADGLHIGDYQTFKKVACEAVETLSSPAGWV